MMKKTDFRIVEFNNKFTIERKKIQTIKFLWWKKEITNWKKVNSQGRLSFSYNNVDTARFNIEKIIEEFKMKIINDKKLSKMKTIYHEA